MDNISNSGPNLSGLNRGNPFSVPDGYFENFHQKITEKIQDHEPDKQFILPRKRMFYAAASIILLVSMSIFFILMFSNKSSDILLAGWDDDLSEVYSYELADLDVFEFIADDDDFSAIDIFTDVTEEDIATYLMDDIEYDLIYE